MEYEELNEDNKPLSKGSPWDILSDLMSGDEQKLSDEEILKSEAAQNIFPYLTLDKLSEHEQAEILRLAEGNLNNIREGKLCRNKSAVFELAEMRVAEAVEEDEAWQNLRYTPKLREARKLFCAALIDGYKDSDIEIREGIRKTFFESSPDVTSGCGGLRDSLELLTIADRIEENYYGLVGGIQDEIIYNYSLADFNGFDEVLSSETDQIRQLQTIPILYRLTRMCNPDEYSGRALNYISEALSNLAKNDNASPLVRLMADGFVQRIDRDLETERTAIDIDIDDPKYADLVKRDRERREKIRAEQESLHRDFPSLPEEYKIVEVAPDMAAAVSRYARLVALAAKDGRQSSLLDWGKDNSFGFDRNTAFLIGTAHSPDMRPLIDSQLGVELSEISLEAQIQLLKFMTEAGDARYEALCGALRKLETSELKKKFTEGFLAVDFGEDFGDALIDIAGSERFSNEQIGEILDGIGACRESIEGITGLYTGYEEGEFAGQYKRAANERLTDAIMVFREISKSGKAEADLGWAGKGEFSYEEAIEALGYEAKSLEVINGVMQSVLADEEGVFVERFLSPEDSGPHNRAMYNIYAPDYGYILVHTRPEGASSFDPKVEYGRNRSRYNEETSNVGTEASISFMTNPVDPMKLPNPLRPDWQLIRNPNYYDDDTMDRVSAIRLDREGRAPGRAADDVERSPVNREGMVSVDLAAIGDREDTPSGKIARLFSVGNKIRTGKDADFSLNHNTRWFRQEEYGTTEGFRGLVNYMTRSLDALCQMYPPKGDAESLSRRMKVMDRKRQQTTRRANRKNISRAA